MIEKITSLRSVGQFDNSRPQTDISQLSLIYGENGRGKTTLVAILRSLATGDGKYINERQRLGSKKPPHIVLTCESGQRIFEKGAWNRNLPQIDIFDDVFISNNVCWGIELQPQHGQNLHSLILGALGVSLNTELKNHILQIEKHDIKIKELSKIISTITPEFYNIDQFCRLERDADISTKIRKARKDLVEAKSAQKITEQGKFHPIEVPEFDITQIKKVLSLGPADLNDAAARQVQQHIRRLGHGSERWLAKGTAFIASASEGKGGTTCPFCTQNLDDRKTVELYRNYFSQEYEDLKTAIRTTMATIRDDHASSVHSKFERDVNKAMRDFSFWEQFVGLPHLGLRIDAEDIVQQWVAAREAALSVLRAKRASPLKKIALGPDARKAFVKFEACKKKIALMSTFLLSLNSHIDIIQERVAKADYESLELMLEQLKHQRDRFRPAITAVCDMYLSEQEKKREAELRLDDIQRKLDDYRKQIFPKYEHALNEYLEQFNSSFRIKQVSPETQRSGTAASYSIVINDQDVKLRATSGPSFRNTLSAGDRNALALSFFFTSLHHSIGLERKIVIIDDPISSLDDHRIQKTIKMIHSLTSKVRQVIVLSHSQSFLYNLWKQCNGAKNKRPCSTLRIIRNGVASEVVNCDIEKDTLPEHDKRHALVHEYIVHGDSNMKQEVGAALRPILEAFVRVAFPNHFPRRARMSEFIGLCRDKLSAGDAILPIEDIDNLHDLYSYANQFHHESVDEINETELTKYAKSTLLFISRR